MGVFNTQFMTGTRNPYDARNGRHSTGHDGYVPLDAGPLRVSLKAKRYGYLPVKPVRRTRSDGYGAQPYALPGLSSGQRELAVDDDDAPREVINC